MKWFFSIFVTSLLARCSSVSTDDFPFPDTDDVPIQTECDIDRPCADPNECCSLFLGQCGADNFFCGFGCVAGPCQIICGDPDNECNPNECCSITGNCGVGDEYCGAACVGGACNDPLEPVQPDAPGPCTNNDQCNEKTECCTLFGLCQSSEGNPYCTYNNDIVENEYPIDLQACNYYSWIDTCPERQCCTMFGRCSFAPNRFCHSAADAEATSYLRKSRV